MTTSKNSVESKEFEVLSTEGVLVVHLYDCCPEAFEGTRFQTKTLISDKKIHSK